MGKIEDLADRYAFHIGAPWQRTLAGAQRVLIVVYEKELERTLRARFDLFRQATLEVDLFRQAAKHKWRTVDCTTWFAEWMAADDYRDAYFEQPELLGMKLEGEFKDFVAQRLSGELQQADEDTVVGLVGTGSLYGFLRISELIRDVEQTIRGRLAVFFPGSKSENNYRLLDARDGWNYLANAITVHGRSMG